MASIPLSIKRLAQIQAEKIPLMRSPREKNRQITILLGTLLVMLRGG